MVKAAAIILSGGKSSRMGTNKALLKVSGQTNIERIVHELEKFFHPLILVTNEPESYRFLALPSVMDQYPGMGPLAGIHAGLTASGEEVNAIVACDMPFVSGELLWALAEKIGRYDAVVPVIFGQQHPLFAVFKKNIAQTAAESIKKGQLRMKDLLGHLNVLYVTEEDLPAGLDVTQIFYNMNHPNEYEEAKKWAEAGERK